MKEKKEQKKIKKEKTKYDKMQFAFKIMAAILVIIMLVAWTATLIFSLIY